MLVFAAWMGPAWVSRASAQVNTEALRSKLMEKGLQGTFNGSLTSYRGNTLGLELGASGLLAWQSAPHLVLLSGAANYSHLGGEVQVANAFAHSRYSYAVLERVAVEVFAQGESDRFRRLRLRTLLGVGPRLSLFDGEFVGLFYGISYMYEHNALADSFAPVRPADVHRFSNYASAVFVLEPKRATISNTVYAQPRLDDFRDLRLLDIFSLDATVTGRLSTGLHATLRYENPVRSPIKRADLMIKNTLGVVF
ncbi:MAG: DUF481 domain-containing protein [Deltaproteobacteria bacterium]